MPYIEQSCTELLSLLVTSAQTYKLGTMGTALVNIDPPCHLFTKQSYHSGIGMITSQWVGFLHRQMMKGMLGVRVYSVCFGLLEETHDMSIHTVLNYTGQISSMHTN